MTRSISTLLTLCSLVSIFAACGIKTEKPQFITSKYAIENGDTISKSLARTNISKENQEKIAINLQKIFNTRRIKPKDTYEIVTDTSSNWVSFTYYTSGADYFIVSKSSDGAISAMANRFQSKETTASASGTVKSSLWESMRAQNIGPDLIISFAEIFAWQIDFLTETQNGDTYRFIWNRQEFDNGIVHNKDILCAEYVSYGKKHTAVLYTNPEGKKGYYTPKGESLYRAFLKAPLQFRRISSFFTTSRFHPILKIFRPHLGIDYSAPAGTPVSSIGDGTVTFCSWSGGFGRLIKIKHAGGFETYYGHLSGFAKKIARSAHVYQGQVIGYVGSSGLSTGPHLDFRITQNGSFINFLRLKIPPSKNVPEKEKLLFKETVKKALTGLANIH